MARTVKTTKTPEQRRAEAEQLHITITEQVEALRESEAWTRFLVFSRAFHCYSLSNLLLALGQAPEASHVVGYRRWQALNRQVRQGERGIRSWARTALESPSPWPTITPGRGGVSSARELRAACRERRDARDGASADRGLLRMTREIPSLGMPAMAFGWVAVAVAHRSW